MQWIVVNLFLLWIILSGAATYFLLGTLIRLSGIDGDALFYLYAIAAVSSVLASYYSGKYTHLLIDKYVINRRR